MAASARQQVRDAPKRMRWPRVNWLAYALVAPAILGMVLVIGYPLASNVWTSLHNGHLVSPRVDEWVGLDHYIDILQDARLRRVTINSFAISTLTAFGSLAVGFIWALVLNRIKHFKGWLQVVILTPWVLSGVITGKAWSWLLDPTFGYLNYLIRRIFLEPFGFDGVLELTSHPSTAMMTIVVAMVWRLFPFVFVMILAGLQSIPKEMYEAAMVDGASGLRRFIHITLPFLRFVLAIVWLLSFVWSFNDFSVVLTMTGGGPGITTMVLPMRVYRFIIDGFRLGKGSALAMFMVIFLVFVAVLYVRLLRRQSEEGFMA